MTMPRLLGWENLHQFCSKQVDNSTEASLNVGLVATSPWIRERQSRCLGEGLYSTAASLNVGLVAFRINNLQDGLVAILRGIREGQSRYLADGLSRPGWQHCGADPQDATDFSREHPL